MKRDSGSISEFNIVLFGGREKSDILCQTRGIDNLHIYIWKQIIVGLGLS